MSILQNAMVTIMQEHFDAGSFINYDTILPKSSGPESGCHHKDKDAG